MVFWIKVRMLSVQYCKKGISPLKIISTCLQSPNELSDEYNSLISYSFDKIHNAHCVPMAFDGLATETNFIRYNLNYFMNGTTTIQWFWQTATMLQRTYNLSWC